jgi:hypothetical protein
MAQLPLAEGAWPAERRTSREGMKAWVALAAGRGSKQGKEGNQLDA